MTPYSQACDNNKQPILEQLQSLFADARRVLEIGSGTGQHAVYFAEHLPHLFWQTSDLEVNHEGIESWLARSTATNIGAPIALSATSRPWFAGAIDAVFTANTLHIMSWSNVVALFEAFALYLPSAAIVCIYGPFNYGGDYTSASNRDFDIWLKQRQPEQGIRDFERINALAEEANLLLLDDVEMPANNRLLVFRKV